MTVRLVLVRHGQASFGEKDYDRLSETGHRQARLAGEALARRRPPIGRIVAGSMRRHQETAAGCLLGMGRPGPVETDAGWNEFDHEELIRAQVPRYGDHLVLHLVRQPRVGQHDLGPVHRQPQLAGQQGRPVRL